MVKIDDKELCCGCGACSNICPNNCIKMSPDNKGFFYPSVNIRNCCDCGLCEKTCPISKITKDYRLFYEDRTAEWIMPEEIRNLISNEEQTVSVFAAYNTNESVRKHSTSGGLFSLFASSFIKKGGHVFGAAFDENLRLIHKSVDTLEGLHELMGSKYVQSDTLDTFSEAKELLESGKLVYYSGTPCQIEGLLSFLGKDYERLFTQDCVCHGVPSPLAWEEYIHSLPFLPTHVSFRDKSISWAKYSFSASDDKGNSITEPKESNKYIVDYLKDKALRPSCYHCRFKKVHRRSDITLGDFWGIDEIFPEMNDDKGINIIIGHTIRGKAFIESHKKEIVYRQVDFVSSLKRNPSYVTSPLAANDEGGN